MPTTHPQTTCTAELLDKLTEIRRVEAETATAAWPQYRGYWDGWTLVEVAEPVTTKGGLRFDAGDLVLLSPTVHTAGFRTCWSHRGTVAVSVPADVLRPIVVVEPA